MTACNATSHGEIWSAILFNWTKYEKFFDQVWRVNKRKWKES